MKDDTTAFARLLSIPYEHREWRGDCFLYVSGVEHEYAYAVIDKRTGATLEQAKGYQRPADARRWGRAALARIAKKHIEEETKSSTP